MSDDGQAQRIGAAVPLVDRGPTSSRVFHWQHRPPRDALVVVVKATCDLVPGEAARLRPEADPPTGDRHLDDDLEQSVVYDGDFAVFKPRADVMLTGSAWAPSGSAPVMRVSLSFGSGDRAFTRRLTVHGDRVDGGEPRPFASMPLVYERAPRGPDNPVGREGLAPAGDGPRLLPNLAAEDHPEPACFGPVPIAWRLLRRGVGTADEAWLRTRWPYFPDDLDPLLLQAAPASQQLPYLHGDEPFVLEGLHPEHGRLSGRLPGLRIQAFAERTTAGGALDEIVMHLDTAHLDLDAMLLQLVWRGTVEVADAHATDVIAVYVHHGRLDEAAVDVAAARAALDAVRADDAAEDNPLGDEPGGAPDAPDAADAPARRAPRRISPQLDAAQVSAIIRLGAAGMSPDQLAPLTGASPEELHQAVLAYEPGEAQPDGRLLTRGHLALGSALDGLALGAADLTELDLAGRSLVGVDLRGARLTEMSLVGADLSGALLGGADLSGARLDGARLDGADLVSATLDGASLVGCSLAGADLSGVSATAACFDECHGEGVRLEGSRLSRASFARCELPGLDLTAAELSETRFDQAQLPRVTLFDAEGQHTSFAGATLEGARADGARLPAIDLGGVRASGSVWERAVLDGAQAVDADLPGAVLVGASLQQADLSRADLRGVRASAARLRGARLVRANLHGADLAGADLCAADLRESNLYAVDAHGALLGGSRVQGAIVGPAPWGGP